MSDSTAGLSRKLANAADLQAVVRTMKAVAASNIGQYEKSVQALADYFRTVELGLSVCLRDMPKAPSSREKAQEIGAIVFGTDQGLVGQFNEVMADHVVSTLVELPGKPQIWAVGERIHARLAEAGLPPMGLFKVPTSVKAIAALVGQIQIESEAKRARNEYACVYVFHNQPRSGALYQPVSQRLLPLDAQWQRDLVEIPWPTKQPPEVIGSSASTLRALVREYLFISLFRACAESLASENASRLAAMERADKNIQELMATLDNTYHRLRQSGIDEELFDVIAGFEALA